MKLLTGSCLLLIGITLTQTAGCARQSTENPFNYPFIKPLHLKRESGKPYSDYRAFYVLTEDFEPLVDTSSDLDSIRDVLKFASDLSSQYKVPWTHFVDLNVLAPAFLSADQQLKQRCEAMIADLTSMVNSGDDCELHLHGPLRPELMDYLRSQEKLHVRKASLEDAQAYRQRKSFFFHSFYGEGYRQLVSSLTYGKRLLERSIYDGKTEVLAFRPGGWDHGDNEQDTQLYYRALNDSGIFSNSGLSSGKFGTDNWRIGNDPGKNLATVTAGEGKVLEVSPTSAPDGYINPVTSPDVAKLARSIDSEMAVIVSVYHLGALQKTSNQSEKSRSETELQIEREMLAQHFKTVADLAAARVVYPITIRQLLAIISEQQ
jgi:hypothetical protein